MKQKLFLTVLIAFLALTVKSQPGGGQPGGQGGQGRSAESIAQRESDWMKTQLSLTADQITKVDAINLKYAQMQMSSVPGGPGGDPNAMQKQMADLNAKKRSELQSVLTEEQLKKYDEYLAQRPAGGRGGFGGPPPGQ